MKRLAVALVLGLVLGTGLAGTAVAGPQTRARWQLGDREPHAGMPFELILAVAGFDEAPAVTQPTLVIPGAKVTPLGAEPHQSGMNIVINGQRMDAGVTWAFHWRVEAPNAGTLQIPSLTVAQGKRTATAAAVTANVDAIATTDAMKLELQLPHRTVYVGETLDAKLVWMFRAKPQGQDFTLPLATLDAFTVTQPPVPDPDRALPFDIAGKKLALPYDGDAVDVDGQRWTRITIHMFVVPRVAGKVEIPPTSVAANLPFGQPDVFGRYDTRMFRTSDVAKTLEIKPLPETDRPANFAGAVGTQFSMKVEAGRSVVQLGEPVELTITIKSDQRLDALALGRLDGEGGLTKDKFTVPAETPTGVLSDDGKTKTFKITAQVTGPATEIPALAFAYFDPSKNAYQTIHSDPIALSVKGGSIVGSNDVVAMAPKPGAQPAPGDTELALVGAELALSAPGDLDKQPLGGALLAGLLALLYLVPLGVFALRSWQHRTREQREDAAEVKTAKKRVAAELARAEREPARDTAGSLAAALRGLARALDHTAQPFGSAAGRAQVPAGERELDDAGLLARIETESFSRTAKDEPLAAELRQRAKDLAERWQREARRAPAGRSATVVLVLLAALAPAARANAQPAGPARPMVAAASDALGTGRAAYQQALGITDVSARRAAFTRAETALGEAAQVTPDRPELLADWGNAALGAGDVGTATLAFRRALAIDPSNARAKQNLSWLRGRQSPALRPVSGGAADTLFFFHDWPRSRKLVVGAFAFAFAVLLVVPWSGRRRRGLAMLAILPAIAWLALVASVLLEDHHTDDAVVMDAESCYGRRTASARRRR